MTYTRLILSLAARYAVRPLSAARAVRVGLKFRARSWYRRPPFLPLPPLEYINWRLHTAYGTALPEPGEVMRYVRWVDRMRKEVAARE